MLFNSAWQWIQRLWACSKARLPTYQESSKSSLTEVSWDNKSLTIAHWIQSRIAKAVMNFGTGLLTFPQTCCCFIVEFQSCPRGTSIDNNRRYELSAHKHWSDMRGVLVKFLNFSRKSLDLLASTIMPWWSFGHHSQITQAHYQVIMRDYHIVNANYLESNQNEQKNHP